VCRQIYRKNNHTKEITMSNYKNNDELIAAIQKWSDDKNHSTLHLGNYGINTTNINHKSVPVLKFKLKDGSVLRIQLFINQWKDKAIYKIDENFNIIQNKKPLVELSERLNEKFENFGTNQNCLPLVIIDQPNAMVTRTRAWYQAKYRLLELSRLFEFLEAAYYQYCGLDNGKKALNRKWTEEDMLNDETFDDIGDSEIPETAVEKPEQTKIAIELLNKVHKLFKQETEEVKESFNVLYGYFNKLSEKETAK